MVTRQPRARARADTAIATGHPWSGQRRKRASTQRSAAVNLRVTPAQRSSHTVAACAPLLRVYAVVPAVVSSREELAGGKLTVGAVAATGMSEPPVRPAETGHIHANGPRSHPARRSHARSLPGPPRDAGVLTALVRPWGGAWVTPLATTIISRSRFLRKSVA